MLGVHRAPRCEPVVSLVRSRRAPPVPLIVLPKSCSCRWGPCPRPIPCLACLFSFFLFRARICSEEGGAAPKGARSSENKGPAGGGGVAERGRGERRDRRRSDKGEHDESGTTARWHEGCSENRRKTAKRDRKRRTPKGGRRLAHHTPLLKIPVWWRRAVLPSLPWVSVFFLSFRLDTGADWRVLALSQASHEKRILTYWRRAG